MRRIKLIMKWLLVLLSFNLSLASLGGFAQADSNAFYQMKARSAYAIDADTGQVLYEKNAKKTYPIASVTKILTLAVIEQDIRDHQLSWNQKIKISPSVAQMANDPRCSNVQLNAGESYTVKQLVDSMMLVSADGSTEALALADAGSTAAFNKKMQQVARKAGVHDAKIYNMVGLPNSYMGAHALKGVDKDAENLFSARDLGLISQYVIKKYPETLKITSTKFADFDVSADHKEHMVNINALLPQNGAAPKDWNIDGLKTGNTDAAGKCIVSTGTYAGRRVIVVALHTKGDWKDQSKMQKEFYEALANTYQPVTLNNMKALPKKLRTHHVVHAKKQHSTTVKLVKTTPVWMPKGATWQQARPTFKLDRSHKSAAGQLTAPLKKGEQVGWIVLHPAGMPAMKVPVASTTTIQHTLF
ncbi:D-alanyl-D-alanine carboxypeptidase family protein [Limosilactobacillus panis]|uniref:Serine hydrolase n=1 Tax=Limosilactobacillus panis TaxID=47493 RepID=A0ABT7VMU2_9LACO|nr:serine hydrolase [Limosilactobacillus panis]MDM8334067.1 serine hydrolase [Limosilactobacillus panis]